MDVVNEITHAISDLNKALREDVKNEIVEEQALAILALADIAKAKIAFQHYCDEYNEKYATQSDEVDG